MGVLRGTADGWNRGVTGNPVDSNHINICQPVSRYDGLHYEEGRQIARNVCRPRAQQAQPSLEDEDFFGFQQKKGETKQFLSLWAGGALEG